MVISLRSILLRSVLAGLVVVAGVVWFAFPSFEPGAGGANELPPVVEVDRVRLQLRLTVWGGGGPIQGRYSRVTLFFRQLRVGPFQQVHGQLVWRDKTTELYEFVLLRSASAVVQPIEYYFEVTLDDQTTTIPGTGTVTLSRS